MYKNWKVWKPLEEVWNFLVYLTQKGLESQFNEKFDPTFQTRCLKDK